MVLCPQSPDWGIVSRASVLARGSDKQVRVLVFDERNAGPAFQYGADKVELALAGQDYPDEYIMAEWLGKQILTNWHSEIILAPATIRFRTIMPILAVFLEAGLTADCTEIELNEKGRLIQVRPASGNQLTARIETCGAIQMATVRSGIYPPIKSRKLMKTEDACKGKYEKKWKVSKLPAGGNIKMIAFEPFANEMPLHKAKLIFAGGMGIGSRENFEYFSKLSMRAGATVGASRMAVDAGFSAYSNQIGQTGVTVRPKIYVAAGISGAVHHLAGMSGSETVIAINTDAGAPIFRYADYGIIGDWRQVLEKFVYELEHKRN